MKLNYSSIEEISDASFSYVRPSFCSQSGPRTDKLTVPTPELREYIPTKSSHWQVKPPKGEMSFSEIKRRRLIKMTPYSRGKETTNNYLLKFPRKKWALWAPACINASSDRNVPSDVWSLGWNPKVAHWNEVTDGERLWQHSSGLKTYYAKTDADLSTTMNEVRSNVISDSFSGFDLLTNLAEAPESLSMILSALKAARHPLKGIKELIDTYKEARRRGKTHRQANDDVSGQWMQYRYGIMPLVLSIQDALKLMDEMSGEFHTSRSRQDVFLNENSRPLITVNEPRYFYQKVSGVISVTGVGKARYDTPDLRLSDLITFNPFQTAWELIPMSFVIDWFVNVGDVIFSRTSTYTDLAVDRKFCISVKKDYTVSTYYHTEYVDERITSYDDWPYTDIAYDVPKGSVRPGIDFKAQHVVNDDFLCFSKTYNTYDRTLFEPTDVDFDFNPSMSWMRYLDAYVLSLKPILKALKALK